jgi:hypothetical protein
MEGPGGWPEAVVPILQRAVTVEYASLTRVGAPIMVPITPIWSRGRGHWMSPPD